MSLLILGGCGSEDTDVDTESNSGAVTSCSAGNVAAGKSVKASSNESASTSASAAVDGKSDTRWSSAYSDPQWIEVDLGSAHQICGVTLAWEAAYANAFQIQISDDESKWTTVYSTTSGTGGTQALAVTGTGRYVRMLGTQRATIWGYSLYEFQVQGTPTGTGTGAGKAVYPRPGEVTGPGVLPPKTAKNSYLGAMKTPDGNFARDLGFSGVVNGQIVWTFGDTLLENPPGSGQYWFCSSDASALGDLADPMTVHFKNLLPNGCTPEWIPLTTAEQSTDGLSRWAEGGTNVVEYAPNKGLVWFLKNDRKSGNGSGVIVGGGVATVTADASGPRALRFMENMWGATEPYWGDIGVTYNPLDGDVYVFGHGPSALNLGANTYLGKVPADKAQDITAYQYWDQSKKAWTATRFGDGSGGTVKTTSNQAIFTYAGMGQSNAFWSNYYNTWMFVYGAGWPNSDIYVMTASKLEGPWSNALTLSTTCPTGQCGTMRYAILPHPEYDPTGKTLLVTWTDANVIYATRIEWK